MVSAPHRYSRLWGVLSTTFVVIAGADLLIAMQPKYSHRDEAV